MKTWLSHLFVLLIALQSVSAMADMHEDGHVDDHLNKEHLLLDFHGHSDTDASSAEEFDCHHNHCLHGHSLVAARLLVLFDSLTSYVIPFDYGKPVSIASSLYRPPTV